MDHDVGLQLRSQGSAVCQTLPSRAATTNAIQYAIPSQSSVYEELLNFKLMS